MKSANEEINNSPKFKKLKKTLRLYGGSRFVRVIPAPMYEQYQADYNNQPVYDTSGRRIK